MRGITISYFIFFMSGWILSGGAYGQSVRVTDRDSEQPIHLVTILSDDEDKAAITDVNGQAQLGHISKSATLTFRHPSYRTLTLTFPELIGMNYQVMMKERVRQMEDVVVSANRWEQNPEEIPQQITQIMPESIALANPPTTADVLGTSGQVFIQKSQLGGGSPIIRGFSANSVLIVIDGVRMNNAIYRSGNLQNVITLDANTLQEAEVVFGPGSVIYGSDALGGVMDFHTKTPKFTDQAQFSWSTMTRYGSAANELTGNLQLTYTTPTIASFTSLSLSQFGDLRAGGNRTDEFPDFGKRFEYVERRNGEDMVVQNDNVNKQVGSGYDQTNFMQKLRWKLAPFVDMTYSAHLSTSSDIPRYDRLIERRDGDLRNAEWFYGPQKWQMHQLQTRFYYPVKLFDEFKINAAYQTIEESRNTRRFASDMLTTRLEEVDAISLNLDFEKLLNDTNEIYYGIELVANNVSSTAFATDITTQATSPASTRYPDGGSDWNSLAAYLSAKQQLTRKLFLNSGVRYTHVSLKSRFDDRTFFDFPFDDIALSNGALSGSLGLVYLPNNRWKLNTLISTGFRSPNVDDVGKVFDSEPGNVVVPNPDLKPETSYNLEYGIQRKLGKGFYIEFVNYYSFLNNALVRRNFTFNGQSEIIFDGTPSRVQAEVNAGEAFIWGFNLNTRLNLGQGVSLQSSLTYTEGEDTIENLPLRHVTPLFGQTSVTLNQEKFTAQFLIRYSGGIAYEDLAPSEQNKPHIYTADGALPWVVYNFNASYQIFDQYSVGLNLENILDTHYRPYSSGISAPGFNAVISLRANF
jgi:hemoglobin/transferrin/lactoferrin receptor protein